MTFVLLIGLNGNKMCYLFNTLWDVSYSSVITFDFCRDVCNAYYINVTNFAAKCNQITVLFHNYNFSNLFVGCNSLFIGINLIETFMRTRN